MDPALDLEAVAAGVDRNAGRQFDGMQVAVEVPKQLLGNLIVGEIEFS